MDDLGAPISYEVLEPGTPVYSSDGERVGKVTHVLAAEHEDIFEGVVIDEHMGLHGHRFVDADAIEHIYEQGLVLKIDRAAAEHLPEPTANPAVMRDDPSQGRTNPVADSLRWVWNKVSGKY